MTDDNANQMREKNEEIHALQEKSRGMIRLMSTIKPSRRLQVDRAPSAPSILQGTATAERHEADGHSISAPEETQLQVKLLKAELHDQMERHRNELVSCQQCEPKDEFRKVTEAKSAQELSVHRARSEACISKLAQQAALESSLAEKNFTARLEGEQRVWTEERRRMRSAHHRSLQSEKESMEQVRRQASEELASTNRRLEIEAREVREARSRQRVAEGKLKRWEQKQESHTSVLRGEAVEAEAQAERRQEAATQEASRLQAALLEAEHQVQRQQTRARLQNEMALKEKDSMNLELQSALEEVKLGHVHEEELLKVLYSEEAYAARVQQDLGTTSSELNELSSAFQVAAAEHLHESRVAKEQAAVAEKAFRVAAELQEKLDRSSSEVQQLQVQHRQDMQLNAAEILTARQEVTEHHQALSYEEAFAKETRLQLQSSEAKLRCVEGSCAEAQMCFDSCYQELLLAQEEALTQKDLREEDLLQLHYACEESLEGLPLVFYEEVCKSFTEKEEQKAGFTVPRYGHILEAVANCVHTLLRENTELQDAHRSILDSNLIDRMDLESATSSLGHFAPLSFASDDVHRGSFRDWDRSRERDAPELHREVFAMHQELANSREELRQLSVQKQVEQDMQEAKLSRARGDVTQMRLEMDEMQQNHLQELFAFQEELQKLRSKTAESACSKSDSKPMDLGRRSSFPTWRWQTAKDFGPSSAGQQVSTCPAATSDRGADRLATSEDLLGESSAPEVDMNKPRDSQFSFRDEKRSLQGEAEAKKPSGLSQAYESQSSRELPTLSQEDLPAFGSPETVRRRTNAGDAAALSKAYSYAETLCDAQRYREALPLLEKIIDVGRSKPHCLEAAGIRPAEVWAYTGVAKQGESLTEESIKAYCEAIQLDPLLHVCHANLASLYSFQESHVNARHHISIALQLDPDSEAYVELARTLGLQ